MLIPTMIERGWSRRYINDQLARIKLQPYLLRPGDSFCFQPKRSGAGKKYTTDSCRRAVHRACEKEWTKRKQDWEKDHAAEPFAEPLVKWSPNQLRHATATIVRAKYDLEHVAATLGHSNLKTSQIYAERDEKMAFFYYRGRDTHAGSPRRKLPTVLVQLRPDLLHGNFLEADLSSGRILGKAEVAAVAIDESRVDADQVVTNPHPPALLGLGQLEPPGVQPRLAHEDVPDYSGCPSAPVDVR